MANESDQPVAQTAKELGINISTLHTWISKYSKFTDDSPHRRSDQHLYEELKQLKKDNARLKEERDILKKAAKYFASETR
jgi:transposase